MSDTFSADAFRVVLPASAVARRPPGRLARMNVLREVVREAMYGIARNRLRARLSMLGISWGIVSVVVLMAYGNGFQAALAAGFAGAFGDGVVVAWPGQTSLQAGGERGGRRVRLTLADVDAAKATPMVLRASPEFVIRTAITHADKQLLGKTLGIFGMGTVGSRVATLGRGIGMDVLAWSARGDETRIRAAGARPATKEEILSTADVVSLHLQLSSETRGFLGRKELGLMKPTAILVNTGRGALVEREALIEALRERRIMGAGLDVFHQEPLAADDPILTLPNVVCSPHNAGQTPEVVRDGLLRAVANVENFLKGRCRAPPGRRTWRPC